ncbi:MAG: hypothetical protein EXR84_13440 [Gammaproteobacteria bacterium]|nr:hypothetical protein [Gammaproteobacteria bacterium]
MKTIGMKVIKLTTVLAIGIAMFAGSAFAQSNDPFVGTWELNLAKSSRSAPGVLPLSGLEIVTIEDGWTIIQAKNFNSEGTVGISGRAVKFDGVARAYAPPNAGNWAAMQTFSKTDDYHLNMTQAALTGVRRSTVVIVLSPDGKTRTETNNGIDQDNKPFTNVSVWDKR